MSKALVKQSSAGGGSGVVPAVASFVIPGVGQLINGESDKAVGVFAVSVVTGLAFIGGLPILGGIAGLVHLGTHIYAVGDAYVKGKRKR
ncbi:MAG: hypothetical protein JWO36_413 [Myxococcales bacterium]|nr:hypothetical protein [Myxococcales bacterium]